MELLKELSEAMGVSGAEGSVRKIILGHVKPHASEILTDTMGNLIVHKKGTGKVRLKVMVDAHMDEVGLMVLGHTSDGMLRVGALGGLDDRILPGKRVLVGPNKIPGVIGVKPIHLTDSGDREKVIRLENLRIDIGAGGKSGAESKAPVGTRIGFDSEFIDQGRLLRGKAFDDRAGCAVLIHILKGKRLPFDLVASFTVQEEVGTRGAKIAAHRVNPDLALVLETTVADDLPHEKDSSPVTELGKGPAISMMDRSTIYDPRLNQWLIETAEKGKIPYQIKQAGTGGTNASSIHLAQDGIPTAAISVPCRYLHAPSTLLHKDDYLNTIRLAQAALARLDKSVLART